MSANNGKLDAATVDRWRANPCQFVEEALADPETGEGYRLLPAERAFMERAFQVDAHGRLLYPEQLYSCPKKSGKTTFAAIHALITTLLFGGRYAEAICVANSLEQSVARVYQCVVRIVECSPWLKRQAKITTDRITFPSIGATIRAIPSDYGTAAGSNQNLAVFDELWAYQGERAHRLFDELVPVPTRKIAARLTVTYAGFEGESKLLEGLYQRGLQQPRVGKDLHAGDGLLCFWSHEPIAPWQTPAWVESMRKALRPNQFLRMIENRFVTTESTFIDMAWWDACVDPGAHPLLADKGLATFIGVDASVKRDSTAIVACSWDQAANKVRLITHRIFKPTPDDPLDFEATIENTLSELCQRFRVREVRYDPFQMQSVSQRLAKRGVPMVEFPQSVPNLTEASQGLYEAIKSQGLVVYPDDEIRLAVQRAVAVEMPRGWKISKEKVSHKIDVVVALAMATLGAVQGGIKHRPLHISRACVERFARPQVPAFFYNPRPFGM